MPWTYRPTSEFELSLDVCEAELERQCLACKTDSDFQKFKKAIRTWNAFLTAIELFKKKQLDPNVLDVFREFASANPRYYEFTRPEFDHHLLYRRERTSQTAYAVAAFHFSDRQRYIDRSFRPFPDGGR